MLTNWQNDIDEYKVVYKKPETLSLANRHDNCCLTANDDTTRSSLYWQKYNTAGGDKVESM